MDDIAVEHLCILDAVADCPCDRQRVLVDESFCRELVHDGRDAGIA